MIRRIPHCRNRRRLAHREPISKVCQNCSRVRGRTLARIVQSLGTKPDFAFSVRNSGGGPTGPQRLIFGYTGRSTSGRRSLGNLYDTNVEYRMTRQIAWTGYFGFTQGLAAMEQIYPQGKDGKFGYLEMMYRF